MDPFRIPEDDVLSAPIRARLFGELTRLRRAASTIELARLVDRHPNTVRVQLGRLAAAGLVESRLASSGRGRPRQLWAVAPGARPGGGAPRAHADLSRWLARAMPAGHGLAEVEATGREIGRELAPAPVTASGGEVGGREDDGRQAMQDALTALGFAPRCEPAGKRGLRYVLGNCPYREAVVENAPVVCTMHRGITQGLLDRLDPARRLTAFVPADPVLAGCVIEVGAR